VELEKIGGHSDAATSMGGQASGTNFELKVNLEIVCNKHTSITD
jgi:hypothetical protein